MAKEIKRQRHTNTPAASSAAALLLKRRRRALQRGGFTVLLFLMAAILLWSAMQWAISAYWISRAALMRVSAADFVVTIPVNGVILRDELLYVALDGGRVTYHAYEGDAVSAGQMVVSLDNAQSTQAILSQIADIEQRLQSYSEDEIGVSPELDQYIKQDETALRQKANQLRDAVMAFDREAIRRLEQEIKELNAARTERISQRLQLPDDYQTLQDKLYTLQSQLDYAETGVSALADGLVSFFVDGAENQFTLDSYRQITADLVQNPPLAVDMSRNDEVKAAAALFKIVDPGPWQWVGMVPLASWEKPDDRLVHFVCRYDQEGEEMSEIYLDSWLVYGWVEQDMQMIVVEFSSIARVTPVALAQRGLQLELILRQSYGVTVPKSSLILRDGVTGVLVVEEGGLVRFKEVTVIDNDGDRALLADTGAAYEIIINPVERMIGLRIQ